MLAPSEHPTFKDPLADVILRSADNVHFRLHKIVLSLASDFFSDMFSLPQPGRGGTAASPSSTLNSESETVDGLPVIPVTESSAALESLFCLCYPIDDPPLETVEQVRPTLEAALKYQMREAIKITTARLRDLAVIAPMRVFAIASRLSLIDVVIVAANAVRDLGIQDTYVDELEEISVEAYRQLLDYCTATPGSVNATPAPPFMQSFGEAPMFGPAGFDLLDCYSLEYAMNTTFNPTGAELVLHTADDIRLGVSKDILTLSSPVFAKELQSNGGRQAPVQQPTVLTVPESAEVMVALLRICYPIPDVPITGAGVELVSVLEAAERYQMDKAVEHIQRELLERVHDDSPSGAHHLPLYLVACRLGMRWLAKKAAYRTLRRNLLKELAGAEVRELAWLGVSAGCVWRLLEYHRQCKAAVRSVVDGARIGSIDSIPWFSPEWKDKLKKSCQCCMLSYANWLPCWFGSYMDAIGNEEWPSGATAVGDTALESCSTGAYIDGCETCRRVTSFPTMVNFSKFVQEVIDQREQEVRTTRPCLAIHGLTYIYNTYRDPGRYVCSGGIPPCLLEDAVSQLTRPTDDIFGSSSGGIYAMILVHVRARRDGDTLRQKRPLRTRKKQQLQQQHRRRHEGG
ncbi:hypothetical protein GY45DRAFT_959688 [Cubamyces sp. BRFM 1775]|nr:hypothetical protein GY45DRAFT_959688 [Cubamyces sp. BRFM 1775]